MKKTPPVRRPSYLRKATAYAEYWVPRLRLENFDIDIVAAPEDFENYAQVTVDVRNLRAQLVIRDPKKAKDGAFACNDLEVTVVHELIHVRFGEVVEVLEGKANFANEAGTEMIAMALVAARRGVNPRSLYGL